MRLLCQNCGKSCDSDLLEWEFEPEDPDEDLDEDGMTEDGELPEMIGFAPCWWCAAVWSGDEWLELAALA